MVGGRPIIPTGRQGARPVMLNINAKEQNHYGTMGGFGMNYGNYGMGAGMYGMPNMGMYGDFGAGCCHGHENKMNFGDYALAALSAFGGFAQAFWGGDSGKVDTKAQTTNDESFNAQYQENQKTLEELNTKFQGLVDQVTAMKNAAQAAQAQPEIQNPAETVDTDPTAPPANPVGVEEEVVTEQTEETTVKPETTAVDDAKAKAEAEAAQKAEEAKKAAAEKAEIEALKKEGITKDSKGNYYAGVIDELGNKIKFTGKTADEVRQQKEETIKNIKANIAICKSFGIKVENGRYCYPFKDNDGKEHIIEFSSLDDIDRVLVEADRIKNR